MSITVKRIFYKLIIENEYLLSYLGRIWIPENMMREYEYIVEDNTYSLLFAEHTLVYLEGTTSGPLGRRGWEKFWKRRKDFLLFSIICICPGSRWKSGRGYYWAEYLPYTIENIAVGIDPDINVGHNYLVFLCLLLIPEEGVRHPNFGRVRESEIVEFAWDTNSCQQLSLRNGGLDGQWLCEYADSQDPRPIRKM